MYTLRYLAKSSKLTKLPSNSRKMRPPTSWTITSYLCLTSLLHFMLSAWNILRNIVHKRFFDSSLLLHSADAYLRNSIFAKSEKSGRKVEFVSSCKSSSCGMLLVKIEHPSFIWNSKLLPSKCSKCSKCVQFVREFDPFEIIDSVAVQCISWSPHCMELKGMNWGPLGGKCPDLGTKAA